MTTPLLETMLAGDADEVTSRVRRELNGGAEPSAVLDELSGTIRAIGEMFERGEIFLPELMLAADAMEAGISEVMPALSHETAGPVTKGTVVIATVKNDIHDIGKNIVATFLRARGFEVHDLGRDVAAATILERAREVSADIIAVSALLTSTMHNAVEVRELIEEDTAVPRRLFLVGGGSVTPEWAAHIGADGTAKSAPEAADLCERLVAMKRLEMDGVRASRSV